MIRDFENKDLNKIMNIWQTSTTKAHHFINKDYWNKNYYLVKNVYIPNSKTYIYDDRSIIKGFISILDHNFIGALFVDINNQSLGIGSILLEYVVEKYNNLKLSVYKENKQAVKFYIKKNFQIIKKQTNKDSGFVEYNMEFINKN
ncbi:MAG: N-acetyltransferase [Oscillospiraceae bacterium]|nr:N-acetyltransferase [Oscillospiraceae bacterium]